jgi:hypothetical protein
VSAYLSRAQSRGVPLLLALVLVVAPAALHAQSVDLDTIRAGRFDSGRMWTFEYPPAEYFSQTYGFAASPEWFERARLSVLRIPGCSASFVTRHGLVATNHHCVRGAIARASRAGENLLDEGFYAAELGEERRLEGFTADRLLAVYDVSDEVHAASDRGRTEAERRQLRAQAYTVVSERLLRDYADIPGLRVDIVPLYHGGRYSAYVFRRYTDVRLVVAPELLLGYFGGDTDNFTFPRHALDFAFLRVYDGDAPYRPSHHFAWGSGVQEGEAVFVIGNPGPTNRLTTMAQLEFFRDVLLPGNSAFLRSRHAAMAAYRAEDVQTAEELMVRYRMFSAANALKATGGRSAALHDPVIMARRADAERQLRSEMAARPQLAARYGHVIADMAEVQRQKLELAPEYQLYAYFSHASFSSATLRRVAAARAWLSAQRAGAPADSVAALAAALAAVPRSPWGLEVRLLGERLADVERYLGGDHPLSRRLLAGRSPADAAAAILDASPLADSATTAHALASGLLDGTDPAILALAPLVDAWHAFRSRSGQLALQEAELAAELGRVRFEIYGTAMPPDGTSSPRITDGVVLPYEYNGTIAPAFTSIFGIYDRHHSHGPGTEWDLPARWRTPPAELDLQARLNFVSTADTYGGNSGSPAVTTRLELVGLNFDRNIEGLIRDFIYLPDHGRNIMVDVRAIREALWTVYGARRIVHELEAGELISTEAEARQRN